MMNNQTEQPKPMDWMNLWSVLQKHGIERPTADVVAESVRLMHEASDQLRSLAVRVQDRMNRLLEAIDEGRHVNTLGELQGSGSELDQLCRLRQERIDATERVLRLLPKGTPARRIAEDAAFPYAAGWLGTARTELRRRANA